LSGADSECPNGGVRIKTGIDDNGNGMLEDDEVDAEQVVCNGSDGEDGDDVAGGSDNSDGTNSKCSVAGPNTSGSSLLGLMLYALIPVAVFVRRRFAKKRMKK